MSDLDDFGFLRDKICEEVANILDDASLSNDEKFKAALSIKDPDGDDGFAMETLMEFSVWGSGTPDGGGLLDLAKRTRDHVLTRGLPGNRISFGSLLHVAAESSSLDAFRWVASIRPESVNEGSVKFLSSPAHILAQRPADEAVPCLRLLRSMGADMNARDVFGRTPVFYSSSEEFFSASVDLGADPRAKDRFGLSPASTVMTAGASRVFAIACRLAGMDPNLPIPFTKGSFIMPASVDPVLALPLSWVARLHSSVSPESFAEDAATMLSLGCDPSVQGPNGKTPMDEACSVGLGHVLQRVILELSSERLPSEREPAPSV